MAVERFNVTRAEFVDAVRDELIDHFRWSSVEGLVELEAAGIAQFAFARLLDRQKLNAPIGSAQNDWAPAEIADIITRDQAAEKYGRT